MKKISSKRIYSGKVVNINIDKIEIKGREITRELVEHPGAAVIIPITNIKKKELLLIKQYRYAAKQELFELPAGTREKNEIFLKCAKREIIEETGFKASKVKKTLSFYPSPGIMSEKMELFIATGLTKSSQNLDFDEVIEVYKITLEKCIKMIFSNKIRDAKTITGILTLDRIYKDNKLRKIYLGL